MKAIVQDKYGSPRDLELREVDKPTAGDDEVLVRVRAASLHPDVWHVVCGRPYVLRLMGAGFSKPKNPIPGTDMAGIVESVGKNVTQFRPGDEVFGETIRSHQWANGGAFSEYVSVRPEWLAPKPHNVTFEQAASVPTSGFIALLNLRGGRVVRAGQSVLVNGAGGGVGALALQLAKAYGAHVTGVNHPFSACRRALKPDGKYVLIGHEQFGASRRRVFGLFPHFLKLVVLSFFLKQLRLGRSSVPSRADAMAILREFLEAGKITPIVDRTYPLSETREAFRHMIEDEPRGKVIISP